MSFIDGLARLRIAPARTALFFCLLVGLGVGCAARSARADQDVDLKANASPELMKFARYYFLHEWPDIKDPDTRQEMREHGGSLRGFIDQSIKKGEADVNGDGVPERIFEIDTLGYCGTAGCTTLILQKQGKKWRVIMDDNAFGVTILDQTDSGYHRLCTGFLMQWLGDHYDEVAAKPSERPSWTNDDDFVAEGCGAWAGRGRASIAP